MTQSTKVRLGGHADLRSDGTSRAAKAFYIPTALHHVVLVFITLWMYEPVYLKLRITLLHHLKQLTEPVVEARDFILI